MRIAGQSDLQDIVRQVRARGASLKATEQPIDTGTAAGKCFFDILGVFAEFETNLRKERQLEGIAKGDGRRRLQGPARLDRRDYGARDEGAGVVGPTAIARALGIGRASVYRLATDWPPHSP